MLSGFWTAGRLVSSATVTEKLPQEHRIARESAVAGLKEIEGALRDAGDADAIGVIQRAIEELQGSPMQPDGKSLRRAASARLREAVSAAGASVQSATDTATSAVRARADRITKSLTDAETISTEKGGALVRSGVAGVTAGISVAHVALTGFADNLDWNTIDPTKYLYAGTRGISRGMEEARLVWESIPEHLRALGPEEVAKRLEDFDWSHIVPQSKGGGNEVSNGIFEVASLNRSRGAQTMTGEEIARAEWALSDLALRAALEEVASQMFTGAVVAAAVSCVIACL